MSPFPVRPGAPLMLAVVAAPNVIAAGGATADERFFLCIVEMNCASAVKHKSNMDMTTLTDDP
jgi:hypothetical protein